MKRVDHRGEEPDELASALVDKFTARHIHHLADILDADPRSLDEYYGEDSRDFGDKARIAGQICPQNEEAVAQLLTLKDNHFGRKKINRTAVVEYLLSEGVPVETMEEMGAKDLLAFDDELITERGEQFPCRADSLDAPHALIGSIVVVLKRRHKAVDVASVTIRTEGVHQAVL